MYLTKNTDVGANTNQLMLSGYTDTPCGWHVDFFMLDLALHTVTTALYSAVIHSRRTFLHSKPLRTWRLVTSLTRVQQLVDVVVQAETTWICVSIERCPLSERAVLCLRIRRLRALVQLTRLRISVWNLCSYNQLFAHFHYVFKFLTP